MKTCHVCRSIFAPDSETTCPKCHGVLSQAVEDAKPAGPLPPSAKTAPKVIAGAIIIFGLVGVSVYLADHMENDRVSKAPMETVKRSPSSGVVSPEPAELKCDTIGQICIIEDRLGNGIMLAATSLRAYEEMKKLLNARDNEGIAQMALTQEIVGPKAGDKVRVLDHSAFNGRIEARLTTGEYQGRKVWMSTAWVRGQ